MSAPAVAPADRGTLEIADGVVEKIAAQVVSEVGGTFGTSGGFLGLGTSVDGSARPAVDVELLEHAANVSVRVGIGYPASIRQAADRIRGAVVERVPALTGIAVHRVDIDVTSLPVTRGPGRLGGASGGGLR